MFSLSTLVAHLLLLPSQPTHDIGLDITRLISQLGAEDFRERDHACEELKAAGPRALPFLVKATRSKDLEVARRARDCVAAIRRRQAIDETAAGLAAKTADERMAAIRKLADFGTDAAPHIPAIIAATRDRNDRVVYFACNALGRIGPEAKTALTRLIEVAVDSRAQVDGRFAAVVALGNLGEDASEATKDLVRLAADRDAMIRAAAVSALGKVGLGQEKLVVNVLMGCLDDADTRVQGSAAVSLSRFGRSASACVPRLVEILDKYSRPADRRKDDPREPIVKALGRLDDDSGLVLIALTRIVRDRSEQLSFRMVAISMLARHGSRDTLNLLEELAEKEPYLEPFVGEAKEMITARLRRTSN